MTSNDAVRRLRQTLAELSVGAKHTVGHPPDPAQIYAPKEHVAALDPDRAIVVGNRGVGKSFWTDVLANKKARDHISGLPTYSRLRLGDVDGEIGYDGSSSRSLTPSPDVVASVEEAGVRIRKVWEAVILRIANDRLGLGLPTDLLSLGRWLEENIEAGELALRDADRRFQEQGKRLLVIFDGLDTLSSEWPTLSRRLKGLIEVARLTKGLRSIRPKLFLRIDQAGYDDLWTGPDISKLYNERVQLKWSQHSLYELLFQHLNRTPEAAEAFQWVTGRRWEAGIWTEVDQKNAFTALAGEYMGKNKKRGNTYDWVTNNLADTHGETTPRAFLETLRNAAANEVVSTSTVIGYLSLKAGSREASIQRITELQDEYWWVPMALDPLESSTVPCAPEELQVRWVEDETVVKIIRRAKQDRVLLPSVMSEYGASVEIDIGNEQALMDSLAVIGVLEKRKNGKVNIPDIFRIGARLKRRGGVKPPPRSSRNS